MWINVAVTLNGTVNVKHVIKREEAYPLGKPGKQNTDINHEKLETSRDI